MKPTENKSVATMRALRDSVGSAKLATVMQVSSSFLGNICTGRKKVPIDKCYVIEQVYGIKKERIRPDVFRGNV